MEKKLIISENIINDLNQLMSKNKFTETSDHFYPGAPTENLRTELEGKVNNLINELIENKEVYTTKKAVLKQFQNFLTSCSNYDTEDREEICYYLEQIMDLYKIDSSDGLLNRFMYG